MSTKSESPSAGSSYEAKPDDTIRTSTIPDGLPDYDTRYIEPSPVPAPTEHKTIDMVPVRLAPDVDPRLARTERLSITRTWRGRKLWLGAALALFVVGGAAALALVRGRRAPAPALAPSGVVQVAPSASEVAPRVVPAQALPVRSEPPRATAVTALPRSRMKAPPPAASASARPARKDKDVWLE